MRPEETISRYSSLVTRKLEYFRSRLPACMDRDDLVQCGMVALLESADTYKGRNGCSFETHAGNRIYGSMLDEIRKSRHGKRTKKTTITYSIDSEYPLGEWESNDSPIEESLIQRKSLISLGDRFLRLSSREQVIITLYYQDGFSMDEVGQVFGLTEGRISQILKSAVSSLREGMAKWVDTG